MAREREIARLQAEQAEQVAAHAAQWAHLGGERGVAAEIALARGVSPMTAEHQLHTAHMLSDDLPQLFDLLHRGEISWAAAAAVCRETGVVGSEVRLRSTAVWPQPSRRVLPAGSPSANPDRPSPMTLARTTSPSSGRTTGPTTGRKTVGGKTVTMPLRPAARPP